MKNSRHRFAGRLLMNRNGRAASLRLVSRALVLALVVPPAPTSLAATQTTADLERDPVRWWHAAVVTGGVAALLLADEPVQQHSQERRSQTVDAVAAGFRQMGEPLVVYPASVGAWGVGLLRNDDGLEHTGARLTTSVTLAAIVVYGGKLAFGRKRPNKRAGAFAFEPFSGLFDKSFPSGHTAVAFALATSLADDADNSIVRIGLYAAATGTGWSRISDDKHWASDVAMGAVLGIASAKLVRGRWTVFGIDTPAYLAADPGEETGIGEALVGMAAGIGVYHLASFAVKRLKAGPPVVVPSGDGGAALAWQIRF